MSIINTEIIPKLNDRIFPRRFVGQKLFLFIFFLVFCFSGALTLLSIATGWFSFRPGIAVSILSILILVLLGVRIDKVTVALIFLAVIVVLSGLYNQSTAKQILYFMRYIIYVFLIYNSVQVCVTSQNIKKIVTWCLRIAVIQMPIILFQQAIYPRLPFAIHQNIGALDIGTGTFDVPGDSAMTFFLILLIIFLLFNAKENYFIKRKWLYVVWLTLTIFVAESEMAKLIIVFVWSVYFLLRLRNPKIVILLFVLIILFGLVGSFGVFNNTIKKLSTRIKTSLDTSPEAIETFLEGSYARGAALKYYLTKGIFLFGDGPSNYLDLQSRRRIIGNHGHFFIFYSEVGQLGWLCSVIIYFLIGFPIRRNKIKVNWAKVMNFVSLMLITITASIMDNMALSLIFCIMSMTHLIPGKDNSQSTENENRKQFPQQQEVAKTSLKVETA